MAKGIVFMGTPHRGTNRSSWVNFASRVLQSLHDGATSSRILSDLERNSETLRQISQQFVERGSTLKIKTFYETMASGFVNCLVCVL